MERSQKQRNRKLGCSVGQAVLRPRGRPRKTGGPRPPTSRELQARLGPRLAEGVAANWQGCSLRDLRRQTRCTAPVAEARQLGMYLAHTLFHLSMTRTGAVFGRDRTTVRHACQLIEDQREQPDLDEPLSLIEAALVRWTTDFAEVLAGEQA
jgi:hypothetical protein